MSELTISEYCSMNKMDEICKELREGLERTRATAEPAKLKDPDWTAPDNWPRPAAMALAKYLSK